MIIFTLSMCCDAIAVSQSIQLYYLTVCIAIVLESKDPCLGSRESSISDLLYFHFAFFVRNAQVYEYLIVVFSLSDYEFPLAAPQSSII